MYPMIILTVNSYLHLVDQTTLLYVCCFALAVMYIWYVLTVIRQIKNHLGIYALHLGKNNKQD